MVANQERDGTARAFEGLWHVLIDVVCCVPCGFAIRVGFYDNEGNAKTYAAKGYTFGEAIDDAVFWLHIAGAPTLKEWMADPNAKKLTICKDCDQGEEYE